MSNSQVFSRRAAGLRAAKLGRTVAVAALLLTAVVTALPRRGLAQQLVLSADVGKTAFFEGEPIYLLVRLQNVGIDKAWVFSFSLVSPAVTMSVRRGYGKAVPVGKPIFNYIVPPKWRGEPVPPGASLLNTQVLQNLMGDEWDIRSHLFPNHLTSGPYELRFEFHANAGIPRTTPLTVEAPPIGFQIREPTAAEENEIQELEAMRRMGWDTTRVAGYPRAAGYDAAVINWAEGRLSEQPDDPFLPFLLYEGLYGVGQILAGKVPRFDPDTSEVVSRLRLAVIEKHKASTAGAHLVQALTAHPDQLAVLAEQLGATPGGEMARYQVERNQHEQPFKKQPPR